MTLIIDNSNPAAPMLAAWVDGNGRVERSVLVKDGKVLEIPARSRKDR